MTSHPVVFNGSVELISPRAWVISERKMTRKRSSLKENQCDCEKKNKDLSDIANVLRNISKKKEKEDAQISSNHQRKYY